MGTSQSDLCHKEGDEPGAISCFITVVALLNTRLLRRMLLCLPPTARETVWLTSFVACFAVGYRVLSVQPGSPAADVTVVHNGLRALMKEERQTGACLVPYFDFIISMDGKRLVRLASILALSSSLLNVVRVRFEPF